MNLTEQEKTTLDECRNWDEWASVVREIKHTRGGEYPEDWWSFAGVPGSALNRLEARCGQRALVALTFDLEPGETLGEAVDRVSKERPPELIQ